MKLVTKKVFGAKNLPVITRRSPQLAVVCMEVVDLFLNTRVTLEGKYSVFSLRCTFSRFTTAQQAGWECSRITWHLPYKLNTAEANLLATKGITRRLLMQQPLCDRFNQSGNPHFFPCNHGSPAGHHTCVTEA